MKQTGLLQYQSEFTGSNTADSDFHVNSVPYDHMATGTIKKYMSGTDTGWIENNGVSGDSKTFIGSIFYRKIGDIVFVRAYGLTAKTEISAGSYIELMQLPSAYRPVQSTGTSAMTNSSSGYDRVFPVLVSGNGQIYVYANSDGPISTNIKINFNFVYSAD